MNTRRLLSISIAFAVGLGALASSATAFASPNNIIVTLRSVDTGGDPLLAAADNPAPFTGNENVLFYEATLFSTRSDRAIGTGIDCLDTTTASFVEVPEATEKGLPGVVTLVRTSFLNFPGRNTVVARGLTSVSYAPGIFAAGFTHTVGDIPGGDSDSALLPDLGTGLFAGRTGAARLSGAVDMSSFPGAIRFNCIFVVDLDRRQGKRKHYGR